MEGAAQAQDPGSPRNWDRQAGSSPGVLGAWPRRRLSSGLWPPAWERINSSGLKLLARGGSSGQPQRRGPDLP